MWRKCSTEQVDTDTVTDTDADHWANWSLILIRRKNIKHSLFIKAVNTHISLYLKGMRWRGRGGVEWIRTVEFKTAEFLARAVLPAWTRTISWLMPNTAFTHSGHVRLSWFLMVGALAAELKKMAKWTLMLDFTKDLVECLGKTLHCWLLKLHHSGIWGKMHQWISG